MSISEARGDPRRPPSVPPPLGTHVKGFHDLMRHRVHDIILVSSLYDSFILSEDGQLDELILSGALALNLRHVPGITRVSTGAEALALAQGERRYNLIISSTHVADMNALALARQVRAAGLDIPVVLLGYDYRQVKDFVARNDVTPFHSIFLWQGDVNVLLAIVKLVEDQWNVAHDTGIAGVQAIILIEDHIRFYSSFLPVIYAELMNHSQRLVPDALNLSHKLLRLRARPKILLCRTFEEAWRYFEAYEENILGVVSDIEFPKDGAVSPLAGAEFAAKIRRRQSDIPVMLQSSHRRNEAIARDVGAAFLLKGSPTLLHQLRQFMVDHFGFGDFVFRLPDQTEVARAHDLRTLEEALRTAPSESVRYHAERNHFSKWLKARTEFALAHRLRPRRTTDWETIEGLRDDLIRSIQEYREGQKRGLVADFERDTFDATDTFSRIGSGSLGGKARGLAFATHLFDEARLDADFPGVAIAVPACVVLATEVFEEFLERNGLADFAMGCPDDQEILKRFLAADFPLSVQADLQRYLEVARYPVAVRSSSLLEDSVYRPFAGIYHTAMLPNDRVEPQVRLSELVGAVKRVYASTFSQHAKTYVANTTYRLEEEKMAVVLQRLVGRQHGARFYPDCAGVARSLNHYPIPPVKPEDGIAAVALGFGSAVVDGETCVRFSPRHPRHITQFSSAVDALRNSQRQFYALPVGGSTLAEARFQLELRPFDLSAAEADGTLEFVGSTYSPEDDRLRDGVSRPGVRLVTFAPILEHAVFPLAEIVDRLLALGRSATGSEVEIEFAVVLAADGGPPEFGFLQLRPLALWQQADDVEMGDCGRTSLICQSAAVLGHGRLAVKDIVVVDRHRFDHGRSQDVAREVARFNAMLTEEGAPYVLIGVGRWGSADAYLGIPVAWDQIAGARAIVEAGFCDLRVAPSQGTHFFQNLAACGVGYFTVNPDADEGFVDWEWLRAQPAVRETEFVRHLRFDDSIVVCMNGQRNEGVIVKPGH